MKINEKNENDIFDFWVSLCIFLYIFLLKIQKIQKIFKKKPFFYI